MCVLHLGLSSASRKRDIGRKYKSGSQKKKAKTAVMKQISNLKGSLDKFLSHRQDSGKSCDISSTNHKHDEVTEASSILQLNNTGETVSTDQGTTGNEIFGIGNMAETETKTDSKLQASQTCTDDCDEVKQGQAREESLRFESYDENANNENELVESITELSDPACWPDFMPNDVRERVIIDGPQSGRKDKYPADAEGRKFTNFHFSRKLRNGEIVPRKWLVYSPVADRIFCFQCKLFNNQSGGALASTGCSDWKHVSATLSDHEISKGHFAATVSCVELEMRLTNRCTINDYHASQIQAEKWRWREVFKRLLAIVQFLAEHNLAFRGSVDRLAEPHNGNFLGLVQLLGKFDPVMQEHIRRIKNDEIHDHYLGKRIQNELITVIGDKVRSEIIKRVKLAKYFAVILDCTPDLSHTEQLSLTIRYVSMGVEAHVGVYEHFVTFMIATDTTGKGLLDLLLAELEKHGLSVADIRGQGYDNGANMRGHKSGVQARLLELNSRAFFTPCACHNYNLLLGDIAKCCHQAVSFFGVVQRLYVFFSASTQRWSILREHVRNLSLKPLSETRWECRIDSVKPIRYQTVQIHDALIVAAETAKEPLHRSEAQSLCSELEAFPFMVALVFWHDILFQVNYVSKQLQSENADLCDAVNNLERLSQWLKNYRETRFNTALACAKEIAESLEVHPAFPEVRIRRRRKMFQYESADEVIADPQEHFRVNCFNQILDTAVSSIDSRTQQLKSTYELFGFLYNFRDLTREQIMKSAKDLEVALSCDNSSDIDGYMLAEEMIAFRSIIPDSVTKPIDILAHLVEMKSVDDFPNYCVALRILCTIPVTVASGERSFSKLKLIKTYLRSSMHQERLNNLAMLSIENDIGQSLNYDDVIDSFAAAKSRKVML